MYQADVNPRKGNIIILARGEVNQGKRRPFLTGLQKTEEGGRGDTGSERDEYTW